MSGAYSNQTTPQGRSNLRPFNQRGMLLWIILFVSLAGFEMFNFSTTQVALLDLLGDLRIFGFTWASILTIAFCGIDFAGIARLFFPEDVSSDARDSWYLFGAWLLAATMNATLTWWGILLAIVDRPLASTAFVEQSTLTRVVPVFLALMVWITRILLIGSFSIAGSRLFSDGQQPARSNRVFDRTSQPINIPRPARPTMTPNAIKAGNLQQTNSKNHSGLNRPEPEYIPELDCSPTPAAFQSLTGQSEPGRPNPSRKRF